MKKPVSERLMALAERIKDELASKFKEYLDADWKDGRYWTDLKTEGYELINKVKEL